ncbi:hypothetical protein [Bhargavaea cecembensis]|uniref:hypothetical protein n=1 Tax=Bhargavaea cecembensis TaxID=394098 RepID=UPI0027B99381|nr:hypothetical protein [Bhargavaea cecembensis]
MPLSLIAWLIVGAEIGFWVFIVAGLVTRYLLRKEKTGLVLLAMTPVLDLILLIATTFDLMNGATASPAHGIAAIYLGVSLIYGQRMVRWADERFRYYILKEGPRPAKLRGWAHARDSLKGSLLHVVAWALGGGYLLLMIVLVDDPGRTEVLGDILKVWSLVVGIDLAISLSYFIWPRK